MMLLVASTAQKLANPAAHELASAVQEAASATKAATTAIAAANRPQHPDLRFFQAAATMIPILFLAMLFQARSLHTIDPRGRLPLLLFFFWVIVGISAAAEVMGILAAGTATKADEKSVGGLLLVLLSGVCFGPYWEEVKQRQPKQELRVLWYILWGGISAGTIALVQSRI
jgi:hypothetical protein